VTYILKILVERINYIWIKIIKIIYKFWTIFDEAMVLITDDVILAKVFDIKLKFIFL